MSARKQTNLCKSVLTSALALHLSKTFFLLFQTESMAGIQASPQDLSPGATTPTTVHQPVGTMASIPSPTITVAATMLPITTPTPSHIITAGIVDGPLSAPIHKVALPPPPSGGTLVQPNRPASTPVVGGMSPRSVPSGTMRDSEGQRVIVTTRTPIFVRSHTHAQTTQSSPHQVAIPRMTAAAVRPTPTGQVMPTTAGIVHQVKPISGQVMPMRGHVMSAPPSIGRSGHGNKVHVLSNGPTRNTSPQVLMQARAQIRAQGRSPGGLVIRERTPPARSPPHAAIRGQQPRIRIPISATARGATVSHAPVLITSTQMTQVRAPFFPHQGTPTLLYQPGNPRLQAALGNAPMGATRVTMTSTGQFVVQSQTSPSPGNGQMSPRIVSNPIRRGLVSPSRARMPSSIHTPSHPHHKPILPSPGRSISGGHQLLAVAGPQQHIQQHAHRPTAQIRAHLPPASPRPPTGPIQAHSHHHVSDPTFHANSDGTDATPMNLVTSPKGSPQVHPVDMSSKAHHSPSSTTIPTQSFMQPHSRVPFRSDGSDSDTSSRNGHFKVTSTARATSSTNLVQGTSSPRPTKEPVEVDEGESELAAEVVQVPKEIPKAIVKPHILTHVIDGFIIEESKEPFPVSVHI